MTMQKILNNLKWVLLVFVISLLLLIVFRNLEQIDVELIFATVKLPLAALLSITLIIGFLLGIAFRTLWRVQHWRHSRDNKK